MYLGTNIAYYRKLLGFTQEQLSERIGVTSQAVSKWENGTTNPDVTLLPEIAKALLVDINALFEEQRESSEGISFEQLCDEEYDALASCFLSARRSFFGDVKPLSDAEKKNRVEKFKDELRQRNYRSISVCEGEECYGTVMISDAFSYVDRSYGSKESVFLFDIQKSGEILSALGDSDVRKVLKVFYHALITTGESGTEKTADEIVGQCGLSLERVEEAAKKLTHIHLLEMQETITNGEYRKNYTTLYCYDFIYVLAILRVAFILAEDMTYNTQMYRAADGTRNYDGPETV